MVAVDGMQYNREHTNMTGGLKVARIEVFGRNYDQRPDASRIIVLITDGVPTVDVNKLGDEVDGLKRMGIRIVGLGITNQVRQFIVSNILFRVLWRCSIDVTSKLHISYYILNKHIST